MKKIVILTLFPDLFDSFIKTSIINKAINEEKVKLLIFNFRNFGKGKHKQVDDYQFGGGAGMVLMVEPIVRSIEFVTEKFKLNNPLRILISPQGKTLTQNISKSIADNNSDVILICGHYEGFDERIRKYIDLELSIGDFVLTGGELPAMIITDSIVRLIDNVLNSDSLVDESFSNNNLLDYPVYTKPRLFEGQVVPEILLSGNHKLINKWRSEHKYLNTLNKRPDLLKKDILNRKFNKNDERNNNQ